MRRLANQSRDDQYKSYRDYQTLYEQDTYTINPTSDKPVVIKLTKEISEVGNTEYVAFGGFFYPSKAITLEATLKINSHSLKKSFKLHNGWNRIGMITNTVIIPDQTLTIILTWDSIVKMSLWGVDANSVNLPNSLINEECSLIDLQKRSLSPETFYFAHDEALSLEIEDELTLLSLQSSQKITLKKCSYCGRLLPIDKTRLGALSFHKHSAKLTKHQNECRACKKWRINNTFNPLRTTDQLHESSTITRERKLFLKEPEILQAIKRRTGEGLKSQIWERFNKKCFRCKIPVSLDNFHLDHTRPLAYLYPLDEHATCLCNKCNNEKHDKFPVDFYTNQQLKDLSEVCGLSYNELCKRELNQDKLQEILSDISFFAQQWTPRTFAATARKISEINSEIDLYEKLKSCDVDVFKKLKKALEQRPEAIEKETNL